MIAAQQTRIRECWQRLEPHADAFVACFYEHLFAINPGARVLFVHADAAALRRKLLDMLQEIVRLTDEPDRLVRLLAPLGRRHAGYGVRAADYDDACTALILALHATLRDDIDDDVTDAWRELFHVVARVMQRAGSAP